MEGAIDIAQHGNIDGIDQAIIAALRQDGRMAFAQIAEQLKVSPGMIRVRFNRLVELGVLKVVAITNPLTMGFDSMAMIGLRVEGGRLLQAAEEIAAFREVVYLVITSGAYDIMIEVLCRDRADLLRFLAEKLYKVEGIRESESFVHLKIVKEIYY
jgi:Lrp/AsnC family transcriptional regulator, regulator for asnA, asnC and gidA